jgi:LasA protease
MKNHLTQSLLLVLFLFISITAAASNFNYYGPKLNPSYSGPIIVDNSQFKYTSLDKLTFNTTQYLTENLPSLLPLREAIDTWAVIQSIHPRLLSEILNNYFNGRYLDDDFNNIQMVFQLSAGLKKAKLDVDTNSLSASRAVHALAKSYNFKLNLPSFFSQKRIINEFSEKGSNGPPLFSYFQPPWDRGELWAGTGVHSDSSDNSAPRNSLDLWRDLVDWGADTSAFWVRASQQGTIRVWSSCFVSIIHPNGWETTYYHIDNIQLNDFDDVSVNQKIANYADNETQALCQGGESDGPHLHFAVKYNGVDIEIDESTMDFTSWKHKAGIGHYDDNCATSFYTLIPSNTRVCTFSRELQNDTIATDTIFVNGFD